MLLEGAGSEYLFFSPFGHETATGWQKIFACAAATAELRNGLMASVNAPTGASPAGPGFEMFGMVVK